MFRKEIHRINFSYNEVIHILIFCISNYDTNFILSDHSITKVREILEERLKTSENGCDVIKMALVVVCSFVDDEDSISSLMELLSRVGFDIHYDVD